MDSKRKLILRIHGSFIIFLGIALTANSMVGTFLGVGKFAFLSEMPFALVGLMQAYLLIAVIGIALWMGSYHPDPRKWHLIGALAHVPPLAANIIFFGLFVEMDMEWASYIGTTIHCTFIIVESISFLYRGSSQ
ncbi:MAG: hypothetical protein IH946_01220 [Bacteroidetes bacterium]|nr:hypothetical protein [Bacteroidota bacterium]